MQHETAGAYCYLESIKVYPVPQIENPELTEFYLFFKAEVEKNIFQR